VAYTDDDFAAAITALRDATHLLGRVRDAIGWPEPIRERLEQQLVILEASLVELDRTLDDARDELL
jgi:hypothetical protein